MIYSAPPPARPRVNKRFFICMISTAESFSVDVVLPRLFYARSSFS